ncbi:MAG: hypothetical protein IKN36_03570 [Clostridia bacterium]|nr:hypothetical protein [Clostridia bacterium]MBR7033858.1 hypothetical protein [Clostridia bacterium]
MTEKRILNALEQVDERFIEEAAPTGVKAEKTQRRRSYTGLKRALLIAAAAVATACCLFMLNANVRAAIRGVFTGKDSHGWNVISFGDPDEKNGFDIRKVTLNYVPDIFSLPEEEEIECEYGGDRSLYCRDIHLVADESLSSEDPVNAPRVHVSIYRTENLKLKYDDEQYDIFEDTYTPTTVRGMSCLEATYPYDGAAQGHLLFGDENVTVSINFNGISRDEVMKIAENVIW